MLSYSYDNCSENLQCKFSSSSFVLGIIIKNKKVSQEKNDLFFILIVTQIFVVFNKMVPTAGSL